MLEDSDGGGAQISAFLLLQQQEEEITPSFPPILPLLHPSIWTGKDVGPPSVPGGFLVWGLVSVCCDSWRSQGNGQLGGPPHKSVLRSLASFTPICHCGRKSCCFVQREVSLSLWVTPAFVKVHQLATWVVSPDALLTVWSPRCDASPSPDKSCFSCSGCRNTADSVTASSLQFKTKQQVVSWAG